MIKNLNVITQMQKSNKAYAMQQGNSLYSFGRFIGTVEPAKPLSFSAQQRIAERINSYGHPADASGEKVKVGKYYRLKEESDEASTSFGTDLKRTGAIKHKKKSSSQTGKGKRHRDKQRRKNTGKSRKAKRGTQSALTGRSCKDILYRHKRMIQSIPW